jgi:hypothetical protein
MHAPIFRCPERGRALLPLDTETEDIEPTDRAGFAIQDDTLEPVDYRLLHLLFSGSTEAACAADIDRSVEEVRARVTRRRFLQVQAEIERGVVERVIRQADYEPTTVAKAAAPGAMKRIVDQGIRERDPRTRLQANKAILQYAGVEPPKRLEITTPDRVIEQMTAEELEALAERRVWPARFREVLRAFLPAPEAPRAIDVTPAHTVAVPAEDGDVDPSDIPPSSFTAT